MQFRPCIDIHNGKVKQIVGGSLADAGNQAEENFSSEQGGAYYAELYRRDGWRGGHVIMLNPPGTPYYEATRKQALLALAAYPGGMQIGGGITQENARDYLEAGASHVIVTSYIFRGGEILWDRLQNLAGTVGTGQVVLDVSCRRKEDGRYYIVTDRWQTFTQVEVNRQTLERLGKYCDEFLVHGVDVEGKSSGVEEDLVRMLASYEGRPVTYAGGIGSLQDLKQFRELSGGKLDFTIGSALDLFGGSISYEGLKEICRLESC